MLALLPFNACSTMQTAHSDEDTICGVMTRAGHRHSDAHFKKRLQLEALQDKVDDEPVNQWRKWGQEIRRKLVNQLASHLNQETRHLIRNS
jgi:hypothetical protein